MSEEEILTEYKDYILTISINRTKHLNALNQKLYQKLGDIFNSLKNNKDIKVLIIKGEGDKSFIAGTDISEMNNMNQQGAKNLAQSVKIVLDILENLPQVTIACINGYALGGGCELALACDLRIASQKAVIGLPEIDLGTIPGGGGTQRLKRLIGISNTKKMIVSGSKVTAQEAKQLGIINDVFTHDDLNEEVNKFAENIANKPPLALQYAKKAINSQENSFNEDLNKEIEMFSLCFTTEDRITAFNAFLNKTTPKKYKGK